MRAGGTIAVCGALALAGLATSGSAEAARGLLVSVGVSEPYELRRTKDLLFIAPIVPYVAQVRSGGPIEDMTFWHVPLELEAPALRLTVTNKTGEQVSITGATLEISRSTPDLTPLPVFARDRERTRAGKLLLLNEGWGALSDAVLRYRVAAPAEAPVTRRADTTWPYEVAIPSFERRALVDVSGGLEGEGLCMAADCGNPAAYGGGLAAVEGDLSYTGPDGAPATLAVRGMVSLFNDPAPGGPAAPAYACDVILPAETEGLSRSIPLDKSLANGAQADLNLRLCAEQSTEVALRIRLEYSDGKSVYADPMVITAVVPRSVAARQRPLR